MPGRLVVVGSDGRRATRTYRLFVPRGFQRYYEEAVSLGSEGLPLVVALHGLGSSGLSFAQEWPFPEAVWPLQATGGRRRWWNQCIVVYPDGAASRDKGLAGADGIVRAPPVAPGVVSSPPPPYVNPVTTRAIQEVNDALTATVDSVNASLAAGGASLQDELARVGSIEPEPAGVWNPGPFGAHWNPDPQDDVRFIWELVERLDLGLGAQLPGAAAGQRVFDPRARYLVGESVGGMLGYRLINEFPVNYWAAFVAMRATMGGKAFWFSPDAALERSNRPPPGSRVSLFIHHGGRDAFIDGSTPTGGLQRSEALRAWLAANGFSPSDSLLWTSGFQGVQEAAEAFAGGPLVWSVPVTLPSAAVPTPLVWTSNYAASGDPGGVNTPAELLGATTPPESPVVAVLWDPRMGHVGWPASGGPVPARGRYLWPEDLWTWLQRHPRLGP